MAYARALLTSGPEGMCGYVDADLYDPADIVAGTAKTLDFTRLVAVLLLAVLGHVGDDEQARSIVKRLMDATAAGSYLVIAHGSSTCALLSKACWRYNTSGADRYSLRSPEQIARFFGGLELVDPGVVPLPRWRPDPSPFDLPAEAYSYGGIGRKGLGGRLPLLDGKRIGYEVAKHALAADG